MIPMPINFQIHRYYRPYVIWREGPHGNAIRQTTKSERNQFRPNDVAKISRAKNDKNLDTRDHEKILRLQAESNCRGKAHENSFRSWQPSPFKPAHDRE